MDLITLGVEVQTTGAAQAAQGLGSFQKAATGAAGAADDLEDKVKKLTDTQRRTSTPAREMTGSVNSIGQAFKNNSSSIQNASFQLQDIIVQMEMGVPISRTLGQQLPQILGGFGPLGAVIGLATGALLTFAPALFNTSEAANTLQDALDALDNAMQRLHSTQKGQTTADLTQQYGAQADAAKGLLEIQKQIAQIAADRAFRTASVAVVGALGEDLKAQTFKSALDNALALNVALRERAAVEKTVQDIASGALTLNAEETAALGDRRRGYENILSLLGPYRQGLSDITQEFGISEQAAANLVIQMTAVTQADTTEQRVAASQALAKAIFEATGGLNMATDEGVALYNSLLDAALAGLDLKNLDLASGISAAASSAAEMARQLGVSVELATRLKAGGYEPPTGVVFDPRDPRYNNLAAEAERLRLGAGKTSPFAPSSSTAGSKGGASGGGSSTSTAEQDAKRLYESTRTEAEKYAAELEKVAALYTSGAIDSDVYSRAVAKLAEEFDPLGQLIADLASSVENELNAAFASVLDGTKTLGEALLDFASNVLAKVAQDLFAQQFASPIAAGLSSILGGVAGSVGATPGTGSFGLPKPFADGGVVSGPTLFPFANGTGLMGEAGPEAIMPLSRGPDGKLGVTAANGNSAPVKITINNYSGQEVSTSSDSMGNMLIEVGRAVAQDITSGGPTYRAIKNTFGISNRLQQRG